MRARRAAAATVVVFGAAGTAYVLSTDDQPTALAIESAYLNSSDRELVLYIDGCADGVYDTDVDEGTTSVTVTVRGESHRDGDCPDYAVVELEQAIGDRALIDGSNGKRLG